MHDLTHTDCSIHKHCCFSWTGIWVGALIAVGLSFLLNLFSASIGLSFVKTSAAGVATLAIGGFIGLLIGIVVTMFIAGWIGGHLAQRATGVGSSCMGVLYGFATWCVALVLAVLLAMPMGRYMLSYTSVVTSSADVAATDRRAMTDNTASTADTDRDSVKGKSAKGDATKVDPATVAAANRFGNIAFLIFVLFFVGALSSCVGGYYGHCSQCPHKE